MTRYVSRWGEYGDRPAPRPENSPLFGSIAITETIFVNCSPEVAWELVSTISRIGEFSPDCIAAEWIGGAKGSSIGARFAGTNRVRQGDVELIWIRPCTVRASVPGQSFAYVVGDRYDGTPATEWVFQFEAMGGG